jgi:NADPH2:quinone reductase
VSAPSAIRVHRCGSAEVLELAEHDPGAPGPGQVRVRVSAAGVNFIDVYFRTGLYPRPLPYVAGLEGAGRVEAVGADVELSPGDRVAWASVPGSYAEAVVAPATSLVRVLVHAAAGGTGGLLIQMLKAAGARVIGTCSTADKEKQALESGCDRVVRYTRDDFSEAAREETGGRGVDVVYDSVGQATFEGSLACLRPRGLLALFGQSSGPVPPFELTRLSAGSLFVTRPSLAHYTSSPEELSERASAVLDGVARGSLRVRIGARFPLAEASAAHEALEGRRTTGKVLLLCG